MPTYITLGRWTQQGIEKIRESPARLEAFKQLVKSAAGEVKAFYMVTGRTTSWPLRRHRAMM